MRVLHLIDSFDFGGSAQQVRLLGPALARTGDTIDICCLGPGASLGADGIVVHALNWTRWVDPGALWHLRELVQRTAPDLIHVWRLPALRALATVARQWLPRVVMSGPLEGQDRLAWWDRWLLQRVGMLAVAGTSDQRLCVQQRLTRPSLRVVAPAVVRPAVVPEMTATKPLTIACVGKLERGAGFHLAIWTFDILCQCHHDLVLRLAGAGREEANLRGLAHGLDNRHVQFVHESSAANLDDADIVWIPSLANRGRQVALEAMARGRVVVAADVPCLREVILDGETGILVPRDNVVALSRCTHRLVHDADERARIGQAAQRHASQRFSLGEAVERWREVYRAVAAVA